MRIRVNRSRMLPRFAWAYLRSVIFQEQIRRESRGASLINIFPPEVERMLVPACDLKTQLALSQHVDAQLATVSERRASILARRQEIDFLVKQAIAAHAATPIQ